MIPAAGSTYSYVYAAFGVFPAWFIGWDLLLEYMFAASAVAVGWSGYAVSFLGDAGIHIPDSLANPPFRVGRGHRQPARDLHRRCHINAARRGNAAVGPGQQLDGGAEDGDPAAVRRRRRVPHHRIEPAPVRAFLDRPLRRF